MWRIEIFGKKRLILAKFKHKLHRQSQSSNSHKEQAKYPRQRTRQLHPHPVHRVWTADDHKKKKVLYENNRMNMTGFSGA